MNVAVSFQNSRAVEPDMGSEGSSSGASRPRGGAVRGRGCAVLVQMLCVAGALGAQGPSLRLKSPLDYQVFQRRTERAGAIRIRGDLPAAVDTPVGARWEARLSGSGAD